MREVMWPTVRALAAEGTPYIGFLYAGPDDRRRRHAEGARVQLPLRRSRDAADPARMRSDLTVLCEAALDGRLATRAVEWDPRAAVGVVLAAAAIRTTVRKGDVIHGLDAAADCPERCSTPATRSTATRWSPTADACLCGGAGRTGSRLHGSRPTTLQRRSAGMACNTAATSATGRSPGNSSCRLHAQMGTAMNPRSLLVATVVAATGLLTNQPVWSARTDLSEIKAVIAKQHDEGGETPAGVDPFAVDCGGGSWLSGRGGVHGQSARGRRFPENNDHRNRRQAGGVRHAGCGRGTHGRPVLHVRRQAVRPRGVVFTAARGTAGGQAGTGQGDRRPRRSEPEGAGSRLHRGPCTQFAAPAGSCR